MNGGGRNAAGGWISSPRRMVSRWVSDAASSCSMAVAWRDSCCSPNPPGSCREIHDMPTFHWPSDQTGSGSGTSRPSAGSPDPSPGVADGGAGGLAESRVFKTQLSTSPALTHPLRAEWTLGLHSQLSTHPGIPGTAIPTGTQPRRSAGGARSSHRARPGRRRSSGRGRDTATLPCRVHGSGTSCLRVPRDAIAAGP